jgi:hypothetical protein
MKLRAGFTVPILILTWHPSRLILSFVSVTPQHQFIFPCGKTARSQFFSSALISMFDFVLQQRLPFCRQLCCQLRKGWSNLKASSRFSSGLRLCMFTYWCQGTESNRRHQHFQCCALPTELPWPTISMRHTITSHY